MAASALSQFSLHHFSVSVPDIDAAIAWYGDIFGFNLEARFDIEAIPAQGAFMRAGALRLELWQAAGGALVPDARKEPNSDLRSGGTKHVAFMVNGLQRQLVELVRRGVDIAAVQRDPQQPMQHDADPASDSKPPAFAAFIRDPAGTLIELLDAAMVARVLPP